MKKIQASTTEFHEIADEVNEIVADVEHISDKGDSAGDSNMNNELVLEVSEATNQDEQIPDQVPSDDMLVNSDEPTIHNDPSQLDVDNTQDVDEGITEEDNEMLEVTNEQADEVQTDERPESRYSLQGRANINNKEVHRYGETQLM